MLFMDESFAYDLTKKKENIKFGSLTGIMVPVNLVTNLLEDIYAILKLALKSRIEPNVIDLKLFDNLLHGSNFMPSYDDNVKEYVLNNLMNIINKNKIFIIRVCYLVTDNNKKFYYNLLGHQPKNQILSTCWAGMNSLLQEFLKKNIVIPVIEDEIESKQQKSIFSGMIKSSHQILHIDYNSCSLPQNKNFFEVLYSKKDYSYLTGLVDCISYCLLQRQECKGNEINASIYKKICIEAANKISPSLVIEEIIDMEFQDKKH